MSVGNPDFVNKNPILEISKPTDSGNSKPMTADEAGAKVGRRHCRNLRSTNIPPSACQCDSILFPTEVNGDLFSLRRTTRAREHNVAALSGGIWAMNPRPDLVDVMFIHGFLRDGFSSYAIHPQQPHLVENESLAEKQCFFHGSFLLQPRVICGDTSSKARRIVIAHVGRRMGLATPVQFFLTFRRRYRSCC
jgi:hypothetical protein